MLKITTKSDRESVTLQLEGKLVGPWVNELEDKWQAERQVAGSRGFIVDLNGVSSIDDAGKKLLTMMHKKGTELFGGGPLVCYLLEQIRAV